MIGAPRPKANRELPPEAVDSSQKPDYPWKEPSLTDMEQYLLIRVGHNPTQHAPY